MFTFVKVTLVFATLALAQGASHPATKFFGNPIPIPGSTAQVGLVPFSCITLNLFCPPWYTRPISGGTGSNGPPADVVAQRAAALANGNAKRGTHGATALINDPTLEAQAQAYAEQLAASGTFQHSVANGQYGENLAKMPSPSTISAGVDAWYGERPLYCPAAPGVNAANGHFTQMVWKGTTHVGYGSAVGKDGYTYIVARYTPPGNYIGQEAANIQC